MLLNLSYGMVPPGDLTSESWPTRDQAKIRALDASVLARVLTATART